MTGTLSELPLIMVPDRHVLKFGTYSPITTLTEHYGWTLGLHREDTVDLPSFESGSIILAEFWLSGHGVPMKGRSSSR